MRISPNPDESEQEDGDLDDISQVTEDRFILEKSELEKVDIEIINSNKKKSEWLVIQRDYICICHDKSIDGNSITGFVDFIDSLSVHSKRKHRLWKMEPTVLYMLTLLQLTVVLRTRLMF